MNSTIASSWFYVYCKGWFVCRHCMCFPAKALVIYVCIYIVNMLVMSILGPFSLFGNSPRTGSAPVYINEWTSPRIGSIPVLCLFTVCSMTEPFSKTEWEELATELARSLHGRAGLANRRNSTDLLCMARGPWSFTGRVCYWSVISQSCWNFAWVRKFVFPSLYAPPRGLPTP